MRTKVFSLTLLAAAATLPATAYDYLAFATTDGAVTTLSVASLTLTLAPGTLTAADADGSRTFQLAELAKMYFTDTPASAAAIDAVAADAPAGRVAVYGVDGTPRGDFPSLDDARKALARGTYVVQSENSTIKIAVK